jgi:hypothetical protein
MTISEPIVFTPSRRDKFKCSLFCFRNYIEVNSTLNNQKFYKLKLDLKDAAFFIAIVGIFLTAGLNFAAYKYQRVGIGNLIYQKN